MPTGTAGPGDGGGSGSSSGGSGSSSGGSGSSSGGSDGGIRCESLPPTAVFRLSAASLPGADGASVTNWTSLTVGTHQSVGGGCSGATLRKSGTKTSVSFNGAGGCEFADGPDTRVAEADFALFVVAEPTTSSTAGRYDTLVSKANDNRGFLLASPFLSTSAAPAVAGVELAYETKYVARALPLDTTTHVFVASRLGTKLTFAVDGAVAGTNAAAGGNDDVPTALVVGNAPSRGRHELNGRVHEVILLRAATEAQIVSLGECLIQAYRP